MALDPKIKAIGFDMDGTVMDTHVDYYRLALIVKDEFVSLGVPSEVIEMDKKDATTKYSVEWLMKNKPETLEGMEQRIGNRATEIEMEASDDSKPFDGAIDMIKELRARGYKVAILTRGGRKYAEKILGMFDMLGLFDALVARDDYPQAESKPSKRSMEHLCEILGVNCDEVLYLGDSTVDFLTARNAGSQFIAVESGAMNREAWIKAAGDSVVVLPTVTELTRLL